MTSTHTEPSGAPAECVLAVDYGERRIGLALAEPEARLVRGLPTLDRKTLRGTAVEAVARIVEEHRVDRVVVGIPYSMDGTEGPAARTVRDFAARLSSAIGAPVSEWDERLSSAAGRTRLREIGYSEREMRSRIDQLSAVLMLEGWLRAHARPGKREAGDEG